MIAAHLIDRCNIATVAITGTQTTVRNWPNTVFAAMLMFSIVKLCAGDACSVALLFHSKATSDPAQV